MKILITVLTLLVLTGYSNLLAQWSNDPTINTPICVAESGQDYPAMIYNGNGRAIVVWEDNRNYSNTFTDIYAQCIDSLGFTKWTIDGIPICAASNFQRTPVIVSDGFGGTIIFWFDSRNNGRIYAQRINENGINLWATDGVEVSLGGSLFNVIDNGAGHFIIAWNDDRNGNDDIFAQCIDTAGVIQWTPDGIPVCTATDDQWYPVLVADGEGGAIISWSDHRYGVSNSDIYAQRIDSSGVVQWFNDGIPVCTDVGRQYGVKIISNNANGALIVWTDERMGTFQNDIYASEISNSGFPSWGPVPICTETGSQWQHEIVSDGSGGVIIAWVDERSTNDIYAQRLNENGNPLWDYNGNSICSANWTQGEITMCSDKNGGSIIAWGDDRDYNDDIYAQRVNAAGLVQWQIDGIQVSTATGSQTSPRIKNLVTDSFIITWIDNRNGFSNDDIYAQHINSQGVLSSIDRANSEIFPKQFILMQNYPNPFNPVTIIKYKLPSKDLVTLKVFNLLGEELTTLVNEVKEAGNYEVEFNSHYGTVRNLPSGIYFYRLEAGEYTATMKMILLK